mgnify:CR=1 FL=1|jgi:Predicted pyridoxal phosphate-dependent enzyme apparently involved in regulation of cell wall biogenesis
MYKSKWPFFTEKMIDGVINVLKSGQVNQWTGTKVREFEQKFSEYFGVKHSVAVMNGTVALELCLVALGLQSGDEVIVTPRTFIASASCVNLHGGVPVFVDVDADSQNITLDNIKKATTDKTKAVILVHLAGWPCDVEEIVEWCHSHQIFVIEDCAQCHGAKYRGKYLGTFGDINAWSFCQDKIMTTAGEGGMVTTNHTDFFLKAWSYKDHGKNYQKIFGNTYYTSHGQFKWLHDNLGTNWRMTEIQASVGIDALDHLENWIQIRRRHANIFNKTLADVKLVRLTIPDEKYYHAYYKYYCFIRPCYLKKGYHRDSIITRLNEMSIPCFQGTCGEVYREKAYNLNLNLPVARELAETSIMFLVDPSYSSETIQEIAYKVKKVLLELSSE